MADGAAERRRALSSLQQAYEQCWCEIKRSVDPRQNEDDDKRAAKSFGQVEQKVMREQYANELSTFRHLDMWAEAQLRDVLGIAHVPSSDRQVSSKDSAKHQAVSLATLRHQIGQLEEQCNSLRQQLDEQQRRADDLDARCRHLESWERWWWWLWRRS